VVQPNAPLGRDTNVSDAVIWSRHRDELIRYATVLVGPAEAEDLLSTVVLRVLQRRSLTELRHPRSYLFQGVLNEARSLGRRNSPRRLAADESVAPIEVDPGVLDAVLRLPERQRAAVYLTYWRDLPIAETAELMGCRPGTVKRYLHLARSHLREVLDEK
jgi:RNA polymerase sigma-70 factor (ECF subfamily)